MSRLRILELKPPGWLPVGTEGATVGGCHFEAALTPGEGTGSPCPTAGAGAGGRIQFEGRRIETTFSCAHPESLSCELRWLLAPLSPCGCAMGWTPCTPNPSPHTSDKPHGPITG